MTDRHTVPPSADLQDAIRKGVQEKNNPPSPQRYDYKPRSENLWVVVKSEETVAICYSETYARLICWLLNSNEAKA